MADPKIKYDIEANVSGNAEVGQLASRIEQLAGTLDGELKTSALASADALRQLAQKDGAIRNFVDLKREAGQAATGLSEAQAAAQKLGTELSAIATPTRAQAGQLQKLRDAVRDAKTEVVAKNAALTASRGALSQYGISTDNLSQSQRNVKAAISAARTEVQAMAPAWQSAAAGATASAGKQVQASQQIESGLDKLKGQLSSLRNIAVAALGGSYVGSLAMDLAKTADAYSNLQARMKLVTGEGAAFEAAFEGVSAVAQRTSSNLESTGNLFAKLAQAGQAMGVGQAEALRLTETVNQAVQLSGASAQSSNAAVTQLIQALQSGVLRGDEFNSMMENSPRLSKALSDSLGVTTGELRRMAEAGQLSSETVIKALQGQSDAVAAEFAKLPPTVGRAIENLSTSWTLYVGEADKATGASTGAAGAINALATNLDSVARVAAIAGAALTASLAVQGAAALRAYAVEAALAAGATNLLTASIDKVPKTVNIVVGVTGFEAGYQLGTWLRETFESARQLGVAIVGYSQATVSGLQFIKEAAAAVFTSDTIEAAADRFRKRNEVMRGVISDMWKDAEQAPQKIGEATDQASLKTAQLGTAAQTTGGQMAAAGAAGAAGVGQMSKAADDALGAFQKLLAAATKPAPASNEGAIGAIVKSLKEAKDKGLDLNALLENELPRAIGKLSGPELARFRQDFIRAMQDANIKGDELQTGVRLIGEQAAKSLGVDVVVASNKMGEAFKESDEKMRLLILSLPELKAAGVDTGQVVAEALSKMLDSARNQAELDAVIKRVEALRNVLGGNVADGLLDQATQKAVALKAALDKLPGGVKSVDDAMKQLGVTSDKTLNDTAAKSKTAFETMRDSGTASARELSEGFKKYSADAIAANGGVASEALKAEGAMYGIELQAGKTGKAIVGSMKDGADATREARRAAQELIDEYRALAGEAYKATSELGKLAIAKRNAAIDDGQFLVGGYYEDQAKREDNMANNEAERAAQRERNNAPVTTPTQRSVFENAKSQGLTEAQALQISNQFIQNGRQAYTGGIRLDGSNWGTDLQKAIDALVLQNAAGNAGTDLRGIQRRDSSGSSAPAKTYTVNINQGGQQTAVNVSSDADARALIKALQFSKASAGY